MSDRPVRDIVRDVLRLANARPGIKIALAMHTAKPSLFSLACTWSASATAVLMVTYSAKQKNRNAITRCDQCLLRSET